jgi:hypothetical protein
MAVGRGGDELLGHARPEVREAIDRQGFEQFERAGSANIEIVHVMRLIEQPDRLVPCLYFALPVGELAGDGAVRKGPAGHVAQQVDGVADALDRDLQALDGIDAHDLSAPLGSSVARSGDWLPRPWDEVERTTPHLPSRSAEKVRGTHT